MKHCRSCGKRIIWVTLRSGKRMPVDAAPDDQKGNVMICVDDLQATAHQVELGTAVVLGEQLAIAERVLGTPLHVSHFATCEHADRHRKGKSR